MDFENVYEKNTLSKRSLNFFDIDEISNKYITIQSKKWNTFRFKWFQNSFW